MRRSCLLLLLVVSAWMLVPCRTLAQEDRREGVPDIFIPIYSVRCGPLHIPVGLRYDPAIPAWELEAGTTSLTLPGSTDTLARWDRGCVVYALPEAGMGTLVIYDGDDCIRRAELRFDPELSRLALFDGDSLPVCVYALRYKDGLLCDIDREAGGGTSFSFREAGPDIRLASIVNRSGDGRLLRRRDFEFERDSLTAVETTRETVRDSAGITDVFVNSYRDAKIAMREAFSGDGTLKRRIRYEYVTLEGTDYPVSEVVENFLSYDKKSGAPVVSVTGGQVRYSEEPGRHFPVEMIRWKTGSPVERVTYTYPFNTDAAYGATADSLLERNMAGAILSMTRWRDARKVDSAIVVYGTFPSSLEPSGHIFRPAAVLYGKGNARPDTCIRYLAYDSLGFQATQTHERRGQGARHLDPRLTRWMAPDPAAEQQRALRAYDYCAGDPYLTVDLMEGDSYLFDESGSFLGRVHSPLESNRLYLWQGYGAEPVSAQFADPEGDPASIDLNTQVTLVSKERIRASLKKAGALDPQNHGFFRGCGYLARNSAYGGVLDFSMNGHHGVFSQVLYITRTVADGNIAHNNYNYGNFLWGAAACELGVPVLFAQLGAHFNNFFLSPDTKGTFDARDDQFSIRTGYHWME